MEKTSILIRNVDKALHLRLKQEAADKGMNLNEYLLSILVDIDPMERYRKLYEEQTHQQAQNTKVLKEVAMKSDRILEIIEEVE